MSTFPSNFSNELLLDILAQANTATAIHSTEEMIIETANDAMIAIWGKDKSVIGKPIEEALPELKGQPFLGLLQNVLRTGQTMAGSDTRADLVVNGELQPFYFDFEYRAIKNSRGQVICVLHTALNVTERYLGRQRELELESELQAINEELASANEELASSNEAMAASNDELAATNEELIATNEELGESQQSLLDMNNSLADSEARFRTIVNQAPIAIALFNTRDLVLETVNGPMLKLWKKQADIIGKTLKTALPELAGQPFLKILDDTYTSGEPFFGNEFAGQLEENGELVEGYYNFICQPIKNHAGAVTGIIQVVTEITEQVRARQRVQQSQNRLRSMVMTSPIGMTVIKGRNLVVEIANQQMYDIWNRTAEQMIGSQLLDVFPELVNQPFPQMLLDVLDTGNRLSLPEINVQIATPDGLIDVIVSFSYDPLYDLDGKPESILATVTNVTEQVKARNELQLARDTLKQAIDSARIGTWSVELVTDALTLSDQSRKIQGIPADLSLTLSEAISLIAPEHVENVREAIRAATASEGIFDIEYIVNPMDGGKPRWLKSTGKAYYNDEGKATTVAGTIIDVSDSKAQDQQKDDFISIASHELKTPVTSLKAALQLLDKMKENPSPVMLPKLIEQSNRSMDKISNLIEDLLNLSRMNEGQLRLNKSRFAIHEMLNQCCNHVRVEGKYELVVEGEDSIEIFADEHRIDQVVVNMVNNAVKYAPNSFKIFLRVEKLDGKIKVSVRDNGPGIPQEKQEHLFERYYRTDASGYQNSGLGLGLFISAEIIRKHGGEIGVSSEVGEGSTFWFTLPA